MRPLYPHDIQDVARALLAAPAKSRRPRAREILIRASEADSYRERTGLAHPDYGNGSLGAAARSFARAAVPVYCNTEYLLCLRDFIEVYLACNRDHNA